MSLLYVIDADQQCIFMHLSGMITDWELGTTAQQVWQEPAYGPNFARLIDASDVVDWRADVGLLRAIASDVRINSPSRVAIVAQSEPVLTQVNLYVESLAGIPAQVFLSVPEAIAWAGVRLPEIWPPEDR